MDRPEAWRQSPQLDALDTTLLNKSDRILKVVMGVLRPIRSEDTTWRERFAVNSLDDTHLIGADLDQGNLVDYTLEWVFDQMESRLEHVGLNANFTLGGHHPSRRHSPPEVASLFDCDLARTDVDEDATEDNNQQQQQDNWKQYLHYHPSFHGDLPSI
jgi:hypothetical protein